LTEIYCGKIERMKCRVPAHETFNFGYTAYFVTRRSHWKTSNFWNFRNDDAGAFESLQYIQRFDEYGLGRTYGGTRRSAGRFGSATAIYRRFYNDKGTDRKKKFDTLSIRKWRPDIGLGGQHSRIRRMETRKSLRNLDTKEGPMGCFGNPNRL
jgi:hypothetical protein